MKWNNKQLRPLFMAAGIFGMTFALGIQPVSAKNVKAKTSVTKTADAGNVKVKTLKYDLDVDDDDDNDLDENVEIKFSNRVSYRNLKVSVTTGKGSNVSAEVVDRDSDEVDLYVEKLSKGQTYTVSLSGIGTRGSGSYGTVKVSFEIPGSNSSNSTKPSAVKVKKIEYDSEDQELDIEFSSKVKLNDNASITIKDANGKKVAADIVDWDSDDITVDVQLKKGKKYSFTVDGIKKNGQSSYGQVSGNFVADDDDDYDD